MAGDISLTYFSCMDFSADCMSTILTAMISRVQSYEKLQKSFPAVLHHLETDTLTCKLTSGNGSDRASQDSRLRSQKGGVEFINFPFGSFGSEICSEQLPTQEFQESRNLIF